MSTTQPQDVATPQPDPIDRALVYIKRGAVLLAVMALAGVWQSFSPLLAGLISTACVLLWLLWYLRAGFRRLIDAAIGIEATPPQAPARAVAHRSEPLGLVETMTMEQARQMVTHRPATDPALQDNPFAPVPALTESAGLRLHDLAPADNILIVGPKGTGKTTLLRALIRLRHGEHKALDPHNEPSKWPCDVIGGGRDFAAIDSLLQGGYHGLNLRYQKLNAGTARQGTFLRHTLVGDEWRAISQELPGERAKDGQPVRYSAGAILGKILTEGRKVSLCVLAASHNDTIAGIGLAGDMAVLTCFDWIVYLGALAVRKLPAAAKQERPAVAYDPERNVYALLDVSDAIRYAGPIAGDSQQSSLADDPFVSSVSGQNLGSSGANPNEPGSAGSAQQYAGSSGSAVQSNAGSSYTPTLPANRTELAHLMKALTLFQQTGRESEAIEQAFGVKKGGSDTYRHARNLFKTAQEGTP